MEEKITAWIARDKVTGLHMYNEKPHKSDVILSKPFNGKTFNDVKALFKRLYLYGEKEIKKVVIKAAKNL